MAKFVKILPWIKVKGRCPSCGSRLSYAEDSDGGVIVCNDLCGWHRQSDK